MLEHSEPGGVGSRNVLKNIFFSCLHWPACHCFMFLLILSGGDEGETVVGIENPAFSGGGAELSEHPSWLGRKMRGDRPDSTLAAHQKKLELQAPANERGEASFFIRLKSVDSRCVPDLTFLSLPLMLSLHLRSPLVLAFHSKCVQTSSPRITSSSSAGELLQ